MVDYAAELAALKNDLQSLCILITTAVEQLKTEITSTHATPAMTAMETDTDHSTPELSNLIANLKHDIATITLEMRVKFKQQETIAQAQRIPFQFTPMPPGMNQCGSSK